MSVGRDKPSAELQAAAAELRRLSAEWRTGRTGSGAAGLAQTDSVSLPPRPRVTVGLPWRDDRTNCSWIGLRLCVWPAEVPDGRRISVVSSRLSRRLDKHPRWFDLLRTAVLRIDPARELLCTVRGTAAAATTRRAADLLGRACIEFQVDPGNPLKGESDVIQWLDRQAIVHDEFRRIRLAEPDRVLVSPPCCEWLEQIPVADCLQFLIADRLMVLQMRASGHTAQLVDRHLRDSSRSDCMVLIAQATDDSVQRSGTGRLRKRMPESRDARSVVRWLVQPTRGDSQTAASPGQSLPHADQTGRHAAPWPVGQPADQDSATAERMPIEDQEWKDGPLRSPERWLLHWTRSRKGPWPDQDYHDWLDELILGCAAADRSEMATLLRILSDGRLRSSSEGIRGGVSVVSFTEVALTEFRGRRVYRSHRHRYDFEPWGLGISRQTLTRLGAQSVIYGGDADWDSLPVDQRWRFQKATRSPGATDNLSEREWRVSGDVDFSTIAANDVCCFVESQAAARVLSLHTPLRIVVVPE